MKTLCETDLNLFSKEVNSWLVFNSKFEDLRNQTKIENSTEPKLVLLTNNTNTTENTIFYFYKSYWVPAPHKYVIGSLKFWYSDDDFSDGSTLTLEIFLTQNYTKTVEELGKLEKPCFTMKIPQKSDFKSIYFGESHETKELEIIIKVQVHYSNSQKLKKSKSFGLRDVKLYLSKELLNFPEPTVGFQDCAVNCDACFGPEPSQCFSCSPGSHWHGLGCTTCHDNCDKCSGPTEHECLGCNVQSFDYRNGTCLDGCNFPFQWSEMLCLKACKSDEYPFWTNSDTICLASCRPPLISYVDNNGIRICENPCLGSDGFLCPNGSCISVCRDPLRRESTYEGWFCKNPCESTSEYLYSNGSCFKECPTPLQIRTESIANFCINPCDSKSLYLYPNGSCLLNCPAPLVAVFESGVIFCRNPCRQSSDFLYSNRECLQECPTPLQIQREPIANFCVSPCHSTNLYLYQNGSCLPCKTPLVAVFENQIRFCRNPCPSTSDYLYANRSCLKECPTPLQIITEPIAKFCVNPCAKLNRYLYSDGSCLSTCSFPMKIREEFGAKYCEPPCLTGEYILKYGACSKECPAPLIQRIEKSVGTFCSSPCYDYFIVKNGTCSYDCPPYFENKIEYGVRYCLSPCEDNQYYCPQNRSCLENCPEPFQVKYEIGAKICQAPCSGSRDFIYDGQLCYEGCPTPFTIEEPNYCKNPCLKENKYLNSNGDCQEACEYPDAIVKKGSYKLCMIGLKKAQLAQFLAMREIIKISSTVSWVGGVLSCLIDAGDPTSMLMTPALKMFQKIIFTEIKLPGNTELILTNQRERILSRKFPTEVKFQIMTLITFSLIAFLISFLLKRVRFSNESKFHQMLIKCDSTLRLNTLIPLFISVNGDILLSCVIDLKSPKSIFCILLTLFRLSQIYKNSRKRREEVEMPKWRFLFEIFTENQKSFILIYFARIIMYHLVIGLLHGHPRLQAFSMMVLSFGMCFYLIWKAPVKRIRSKIQYLVVEFALLCYNVIFCLLAIFDFQGSDVLGQLMNILYLITSVITTFIIVIKIFYMIYLSWSSLENSQPGHIQLGEMNQDTPPESVRFEPLNQIEVNPPPNFGKINNFDT